MYRNLLDGHCMSPHSLAQRAAHRNVFISQFFELGRILSAMGSFPRLEIATA